MNTQASHNIVGTVSISDDSRYYDFAIEKINTGIRIHCPLYCPEKFISNGYGLLYKIELSYWINWREVPLKEFSFSRLDCLAEPTFTYMDNIYSEYIDINVQLPDYNVYVVMDVEDKNSDISHIEYEAGQGVILKDDIKIGGYLKIQDNNFIPVFTINGTPVDDVINTIKKYYGDGDYKIKTTMYVNDTTDVYDMFETDPSDNIIPISTNDVLRKYIDNSLYIEGLRVRPVLTLFKLIDNEYIRFIGIGLNSYTLKQDQYMAYHKGVDSEYINIENLNMNIIKPRIINKTIQQIVNMTSKSDSKANIIQPIFFRVRDLAGIVVHPAVTENICINLDNYKSQVDSFYLKIGSAVFKEVSRVSAGIVFNIKGNLLSTDLAGGKYYILNQDGDMVTYGSYMIEQ